MVQVVVVVHLSVVDDLIKTGRLTTNELYSDIINFSEQTPETNDETVMVVIIVVVIAVAVEIELVAEAVVAVM